MLSERDKVARLLRAAAVVVLTGGGEVVHVVGDRTVLSSLCPRECDGGRGGGGILVSREGDTYSRFSLDGEYLSASLSATLLSDRVFSSTGLSAARLSLLPNPLRHSSSRTFFGLTSILGVVVVVVTWAACSRCSHCANAEFFLTGLSLRSRLELVRGATTKGSGES